MLTSPGEGGEEGFVDGAVGEAGEAVWRPGGERAASVW